MTEEGQNWVLLGPEAYRMVRGIEWRAWKQARDGVESLLVFPGILVQARFNRSLLE